MPDRVKRRRRAAQGHEPPQRQHCQHCGAQDIPSTTYYRHHWHAEDQTYHCPPAEDPVAQEDAGAQEDVGWYTATANASSLLCYETAKRALPSSGAGEGPGQGVDEAPGAEWQGGLEGEGEEGGGAGVEEGEAEGQAQPSQNSAEAAAEEGWEEEVEGGVAPAVEALPEQMLLLEGESSSEGEEGEGSSDDEPEQHLPVEGLVGDLAGGVQDREAELEQAQEEEEALLGPMGVPVDQQEAEEEAEEEAGGHPDREGSLRYYMARKDQPVCTGSQVSVIQASVDLLEAKRSHHTRDTAFTQQQRYTATRLLPVPNLLPPSYHLMEGIVGVEPLEAVAYHVCLCDRHSWDPLPKIYWAEHKQDRCPKEGCNLPRFKVVLHASGSERIMPQKEFYYLGLARAIRACYADAAWVKDKAKGREDNPGTFWGSVYGKKLRALYGGMLEEPTSGAWELGFDGVQIFTFKTHSTGVLCIRCAELLPGDRGKAAYCQPLLILPGPKEPKEMLAYLRPLERDLLAFGPTGEGLVVSEALADPLGGPPTHHEVLHRAFLVGVAADSPARQKLTDWPGQGGYRACGWCLFEGAYLQRGMRFAGYAMAAAQPLLGEGEEAYVGEPRLLLSDAQQLARGLLVRRQPELSQQEGCNGISPLLHGIPYASLINTHQLPTCHAFLLGLVRKFIATLLEPAEEDDSGAYKVGRAAKRRITARGRQLKLTSDFARPYKDLVKYHKSFLADEWFRFVECFSVYVMPEDCLTALAWNMWSKLRSAALHYLRVEVVNGDIEGPGSTYNWDVRRQAAQDLWEYAVLVEQNFPVRQLTYNLHILVCRLIHQEAARGCTGYELELWVERFMQFAKSNVKFRTSAHPEKLLVHDLLLDFALTQIKRTLPAADAPPAHNPNPNTDDGAEGGTQLLGVGKRLGGQPLAEALHSVRGHLARKHPHAALNPAILAAAVEGRVLLTHTWARKGQQELFYSNAHERTKTRVNVFVELRVTLEGVEATYMGEVLYFLLVRAAPNAPANSPAAHTERLAVCRLHRLRQGAGEAMVIRLGDPLALIEAVPIETLLRKLVIAKEGRRKVYGIRYHNRSGMV